MQNYHADDIHEVLRNEEFADTAYLLDQYKLELLRLRDEVPGSVPWKNYIGGGWVAGTDCPTLPVAPGNYQRVEVGPAVWKFDIEIRQMPIAEPDLEISVSPQLGADTPETSKLKLRGLLHVTNPGF